MSTRGSVVRRSGPATAAGAARTGAATAAPILLLVLALLAPTGSASASPQALDRPGDAGAAPWTSSACGILPLIYPELTTGNGSANASFLLPPSFPGGPPSGNNSSAGGPPIGRIGPPFNITFGELREAWNQTCEQPSFEATAAVQTSLQNFSAGGGWNGSADFVYLSFGFVWTGPCNASVDAQNGLPNGTVCEFEEDWISEIFANDTVTTSGPEEFSGVASTYGPGSPSAGGNGTPTGGTGRGPALPPTSTSETARPSWIPEAGVGLLAVVGLLAIVLVTTRRPRPPSGTTPRFGPGAPSGTAREEPPPVPSDEDPDEPDALADLF
jgi:hypothetical protein